MARNALIGRRFYHKAWLDPMTMDEKPPKPQLFQVTTVRQGLVYFKPVYNYGDREELGTGFYCPIDCFQERDVLQWA